MVTVEEIQQLWSSNEGQDLSTALIKLLDLLQQARESSVDIPLDLELDIILAANYALGYGNEIHEARVLFSLLKALSTDDTRDSPKSQRLACTACSAFINRLITDVQSQTSSSLDILKILDNTVSNETVLMLATMQAHLFKFVSPTINSWTLELLSFILILYCMQLTLDPATVPGLEPIKQVMAKIPPNSISLLEQWRSQWTEKSDYFRFTTMMLTGQPPQEDLWQTIASDIYPVM